MFSSRVIFLSLAFLFLWGSLSWSLSTGKGLVLLDSMQIKNSHSLFFQKVAETHELEYFESTDPQLKLSLYGEYLYDILIIFAPSTDAFGGAIDIDAILNFIDDGNSVFIAGGTEVSDFIREVSLECGVEFEDDEHFVIDHFNFDQSDFDGDHTLIVADNFVNAPLITGSDPAPVLFRGVGHTLEKDNQLLIPILRASPTAYSSSEVVGEALNTNAKGSDLLFVSALQARNNARVTFSGSLEMFSDEFFTSNVQRYQPSTSSPSLSPSGNQKFSENLIRWTFGQQGVLRASNLRHHRVGESEQLSLYTVKEEIEVSVDIDEWNGKEWVPYNGSDIQLEFQMLDPYIRTFLKKQGNTHTFRTQFTIPDVYGIFTFRLVYQRLGYTSLSLIDRVTIRPLRHDQYERFIVSAYPYYASSFSMMAGLFVFSVLFLFHRDESS